MAATVKLAVWPAVTVWLPGWVAIVGAVGTEGGGAGLLPVTTPEHPTDASANTITTENRALRFIVRVSRERSSAAVVCEELEEEQSAGDWLFECPFSLLFPVKSLPSANRILNSKLARHNCTKGQKMGICEPGPILPGSISIHLEHEMDAA
jgi:hypothetical protein